MAAGEITFGADRDLIPWIWPLSAIGAAVILTAVLFLSGKEEQTVADYAIFALGLILVVLGIIFSVDPVLGIVFGGDPLVGYSLFGVGVLLSIISAIKSALAI
jgi:hypothetical protein